MGSINPVHAHDLLFAHEAHGSPADVDTLRAELRTTHIVFHTLDPNPSAGGLLCIIGRNIYNITDSFIIEYIYEGRAMGIILYTRYGILQIAGVHIIPEWDTPKQKLVLSHCKSSFLSPSLAAGFLLGDFNFASEHDLAYSGRTQNLYHTPTYINTFFDIVFSNFTELHQPDFAYKHVSFFRVLIVSIATCSLQTFLRCPLAQLLSGSGLILRLLPAIISQSLPASSLFRRSAKTYGAALDCAA
jgi:hypothetical protein